MEQGIDPRIIFFGMRIDRVSSCGQIFRRSGDPYEVGSPFDLPLVACYRIRTGLDIGHPDHQLVRTIIRETDQMGIAGMAEQAGRYIVILNSLRCYLQYHPVLRR